MANLEELNFTGWENIRPISEMVYQALKSNILSGALIPGTYLTEISVSNAFGVSRTPVREALRRLENEKYLQTIPRKGVVVQNIRTTDAIALYDISFVLESYAAKLAASNITTQQLELLEALASQEQLPRTEGNSNNVEHSRLEENYDFHTLIASASGNNYLLDYILQIREKMKLLQTANTSLQGHTRAPSHHQIFEAIRDGNGEVASILMGQHIQEAKARFLHGTK